MKMRIRLFLILALSALFSLNAWASSPEEKKGNGFNLSEFALHHIKDSHSFDIPGVGTIPLPIILINSKGVSVFSSSQLENDAIVKKNNGSFISHGDKIYDVSDTNSLQLDTEKNIISNKPLDFSITKNVSSMFLSMAILLAVALAISKFYKSKNYIGIPKGITNAIEMLVSFIKDEIAIPNIGEKKYKRYLPYLLTVFVFIWLNNLIGIIPFFPFNSNLSGNISFTLTLAALTFLITNISGNKNYWKHILWMPGVPIPMKIFMGVLELVGVFTKPLSLMIRLFANITAGHIMIISLISLIFLFSSYFVAPASILASILIFVIEFLVILIQAYIFTTLSALYIGSAVAEEEH